MNDATYKVTLSYLCPDADRLDPDEEWTDLGLVDEARLRALLENFARLPAPRRVERDPRIVITASTGKFSIQTDRGRLFLYDARDVSVPFVELTPEAIIRQLSASPVAPAPAETPLIVDPPRSTHRGIAIAILAAGLALNGYTLYSVFYIDSVNAQPSLNLITEPADAAAAQRDLAGTYATGRNAGDRGIVVAADGSVRFMEFGPKGGNRYETSDSYRVGYRDKNTLCLSTPDNGTIEVVNHSSLRYYGDLYRRQD